MLSEGESSHDAEDENYFVSMTDMMVGILFIFIIMLMVFALNFRQKTDEQKDKLEIAQELTEQIENLQARINEEFALLDKADTARRQLLETIKDRLQAQGLSVQVDEANGVLRLTENAVRFASNKSDLDATARGNVQKIAQTLAQTLPAYARCVSPEACPEGLASNRIETVFIEGHTDVTGDDGRNWQLSTERAVNTYRTIIDGAPALRSLLNSENREILSVSGYASTRPVKEGQSEEDYRLNRRIDLRFVMEANQRERLSQVKKLLGDMQSKIQELRGSDTSSRKGNRVGAGG
ncbi:flagellar motor protein MotB [Agrobacterium vitis]|nr:flagellar motor protein MotB [Agrobacterium vitis]MBE1439072.1 flagellar motor protein MotB [Agrobacterium vitis]